MNADQVMREQLLALLRGGNAHMGLEGAVVDLPLEQINTKPPNVPYTFWHLLEHVRIAQWDILEFVRDPGHVSPGWPDGYWPAPDEQADPALWEKTLNDFRADLKALEALVMDPKTDFFAPIPHAPTYTIFREVVLVADHNAYHIGEFAILRQIVNAWPAGRRG